MELGKRIKAARLEAGLSQRQLCGDRLTRNMLSQIENGSARPSMATLGYFAQVLGKPVSWFLEEQTVTSPNQEGMALARQTLAQGDLAGLRRALDGFRLPDDTFFQERQLLEFTWHLLAGQQALAEDRVPYGVVLLYRALELEGLYITPDLRARCRLALALAGEPVTPEPVDDALLALAMNQSDPSQRLRILQATQAQTPRWHRAMGEAFYALGQYAQARQHLEQAPQVPGVLTRLEDCCRELEDYQGAYRYACLLRG